MNKTELAEHILQTCAEEFNVKGEGAIEFTITDEPEVTTEEVAMEIQRISEPVIALAKRLGVEANCVVQYSKESNTIRVYSSYHYYKMLRISEEN